MAKHTDTWKKIDAKKQVHEKRQYSRARAMYLNMLKELTRIDNFNNIEQAVNIAIKKENVESYFTALYQDVGPDFAENSLFSLNKSARKDLTSNIWMQEMLNYARTVAGDRIESITLTSREKAKKIIRQALAEAGEQGLGIADTESLVRERLASRWGEITKFSSMRIVRTEVLTACNAAQRMAVERLGITVTKTWITAPMPARFKDRHLLDPVLSSGNYTIPFNEEYVVGIYRMMYPGDPAAGPEEVINCRCVEIHTPVR